MGMALQPENKFDMRVKADAPQSVKDMIEGGVDSYSNDVVGEKRTPCFVTLYDGDHLLGGLRGESLGPWFYIKHLWVDAAYRQQGLGMDLMMAAEQEARQRGCGTIWVDTLSYQAPDFYKKAGYQAMATVPHYRGSHDRVFFRKDI